MLPLSIHTLLYYYHPLQLVTGDDAAVFLLVAFMLSTHGEKQPGLHA